MKKIAVISDTHGLIRPEVKENLKGCDVILHAGDINRPELLDELREIAPVCAVCGNADVGWADTVGLPETRRPELFGLRIFMIHNKGQINEDVSDCDILIFGHSHKYLEKQEDGVFWLNPGSCGPRRFTMPITMAVIETEGDGSFAVRKINIPYPEPASKKASAGPSGKADRASVTGNEDSHARVDSTLIAAIIRDVDAKKSISSIAKKYRISESLAEQICRLYVTHPGIDAEGVLNKMMIPGH